MKALIDTNVILDVFTGRQPHYDASAAFLKLCGRTVTGIVIASQTTDIFYLLRREGKDIADVKLVIQKLIDNIKVADVTVKDVRNALESDMPDYEDALLAFCGKRLNADYIVTRNETDFAKSPIPALSPQVFVERSDSK